VLTHEPRHLRSWLTFNVRQAARFSRAAVAFKNAADNSNQSILLAYKIQSKYSRQNMPALSAHANTENTALVILTKKGYQVWHDTDADVYCAEKEGWDFSASTTTELLGVIGIFEFHKPTVFKEYWWSIQVPWIIESLSEQAQKYTPVWKKK